MTAATRDRDPRHDPTASAPWSVGLAPTTVQSGEDNRLL